MREALLDAAYDAVVAGDWEKARMADVAATAGVSRQTLYNEFGSKDALAQALALREAGRFLDGSDTATDGASTPSAAVEAAVEYTLRAGADNLLVKATLTGHHNESLLPFLTTRGEPLLFVSRTRLAARLVERWPWLDTHRAAMVADVVVRLTVSHLILPVEDPSTAARDVASFVRPLLEETP